MRKGNSAENARRGCAIFAVIPAIERESPSVCENASRVSRHCVGNAPPTLPYPVILNGNAVIYDTWQLVAIVELSSLG